MQSSRTCEPSTAAALRKGTRTDGLVDKTGTASASLGCSESDVVFGTCPRSVTEHLVSTSPTKLVAIAV